MSDASKMLRSYIERPMSVFADCAIATGIAVVGFLLLGIILPSDGLFGGVRAGLAGVLGAAVYMRARTNLIDPAPAFRS